MLCQFFLTSESPSELELLAPVTQGRSHDLQVWYRDTRFRAGVYSCEPPANGNVEVRSRTLPLSSSCTTHSFPLFLVLTSVPTSSPLLLPPNLLPSDLRPNPTRKLSQTRSNGTTRCAGVFEIVLESVGSRVQETEFEERTGGCWDQCWEIGSRTGESLSAIDHESGTDPLENLDHSSKAR